MSLRSAILLSLVALGGADAALAGSLYRCVDKNGITAFTSSRAGYSKCRLVGNFPAPPKAAPAAASAAATPPAGAAVGATEKRVEFRTAAGTGEPKAVPTTAGAAPKVSRGAVYKYTKNGVTHYTNRRPAGQRAQVLFTYIETCFACSAAPGIDFNEVGLNLTAYADEVAAAATQHGVDPALVRAVMHAESAFNPNAVSRAGAQGLMQLIPATATRFGVDSAFDPGQNIGGGVAYLAWLLKRFDGDITRATAGYNAGEGAVDRYDGVPPYEETMRYVERVAILHGRYQSAMTTPAATAHAAAPAAAGAAN
jgi:soluble lytic murein transglycosylase-like protein